MSHVKVENVFGVGPLDADGKGLEGMEGEGHQSPRGHGDQGRLGEPRVYFELEQARFSRVKPAKEFKSNRDKFPK